MSLERRISVIPAKFPMTGSTPANPAWAGKIPPRPPLIKGGWGGFESYFLTKPESRVPGENRNPVSRMAPDFRRDDVWTPVSTGVTTFYDSIISGGRR